MQADEALLDKHLEDKEAVSFARTSLQLLASNASTSDLILNELNHWKDESMMAETVLAIGGAISLIMLLCTSKIAYDKKNGWDIIIGGLGPDDVRARGEVVEMLLGKIPSLKSLFKKSE